MKPYTFTFTDSFIQSEHQNGPIENPFTDSDLAYIRNKVISIFPSTLINSSNIDEVLTENDGFFTITGDALMCLKKYFIFGSIEISAILKIYIIDCGAFLPSMSSFGILISNTVNYINSIQSFSNIIGLSLPYSKKTNKYLNIEFVEYNECIEDIMVALKLMNLDSLKFVEYYYGIDAQFSHVLIDGDKLNLTYDVESEAKFLEFFEMYFSLKDNGVGAIVPYMEQADQDALTFEKVRNMFFDKWKLLGTDMIDNTLELMRMQKI